MYTIQGDVQMCAMLACIAPSELGISARRALQFIEAYLGSLPVAVYQHPILLMYPQISCPVSECTRFWRIFGSTHRQLRSGNQRKSRRLCIPPAHRVESRCCRTRLREKKASIARGMGLANALNARKLRSCVLSGT